MPDGETTLLQMVDGKTTVVAIRSITAATLVGVMMVEMLDGITTLVELKMAQTMGGEMTVEEMLQIRAGEMSQRRMAVTMKHGAMRKMLKKRRLTLTT